VTDSRGTTTRPSSERARTTARRSPLTGRAAILLLVVAALVLSMVVPLRAFFEQRADLAALRATTSAQEQRVAELEATKLRWQDRAYVEAQARSRLHFVLPGEVGYVVLGPEEAPAPGSAEKSSGASEQAWFSKVWGSVSDADDAQNSDTARIPGLEPADVASGDEDSGARD
jgi:cell division protein FtsB